MARVRLAVWFLSALLLQSNCTTPAFILLSVSLLHYVDPVTSFTNEPFLSNLRVDLRQMLVHVGDPKLINKVCTLKQQRHFPSDQ